MFFEQLEARRLMSVVAGDPNTLNGVTVTQSGSGTLTIKGGSQATSFSVVEAGTRNDTGGIIANTGSGNIAVIDQFGDEVIYGNVNLAKPVNVTLGGKGGTVLFDGDLHTAKLQGGGGPNNVTLIDEGAGGSSIQLGGGTNNVSVPFSHHLLINDGGGVNNINVNTDFNQNLNGATTDGMTATAGNQNQNSPGTESVNVNGNQTADLITVQVGGGGNTITDYAGNLKITAGSGFDTLFVQSDGPQVVINNPPSNYQTDWVDVIKETGINQIDTFTTA